MEVNKFKTLKNLNGIKDFVENNDKNQVSVSHSYKMLH